jgi:hypothetical protein
MGQAKLRGTFEQRRAIAVAREEQQVSERKQAELKRRQDQAERIANMPSPERATRVVPGDRVISRRLLWTSLMGIALANPVDRSAK